MRVVIESERTLVVEAPGPYAKYIFLLVVIPLILIHAVFFYPLFASLLERSRDISAYAFLGVSVFAYILLGYLVLGPLRDKVTVTFHGLKTVVTIEHALPFAMKKTSNLPFQDFKQFEISAPEDYGFCKIRMNDGQDRLLFRIRKGDNWAAIQRLEMVTRKRVLTVR